MENWKKLIDHYSISDKGRVRNDNNGYILKPFLKGRKVVVGLTLYNNSEIKQVGIATSVARAFIGEHVRKVVRIDRNIYNNTLENLKVYSN